MRKLTSGLPLVRALAAAILIMTVVALPASSREPKDGAEPNPGVGATMSRGPDSSRQIVLAAGSFDPLEQLASSPLPVIDDESVSPGKPAYWLAQVNPGRVPEAVRAIKRSGALIAGVVPSDTYIVRAHPEQKTEFASDDAFRWTGLLQPGWKFSPSLLAEQYEPYYQVSMFDAEPRLRAARRSIEAIPGVEVLPVSGDHVLLVRADAARIPAIASVSAVEWIAPPPKFETHNSEARWVLDTGIRDAYAATAPGRLTGEGQTAAVADLAINYLPDSAGNALAYFSDCEGGACKEADFVQVQPGDTPEALENVRATGSGHRKMAAYFELGATGLEGVDPSLHGAHVAGSVTGDIGGPGEWNQSDGIAPGARLVHQNIESTAGAPTATPMDLYDLFRQAYRPRDPSSVKKEWDPNEYSNYEPHIDARAHNNSWGAVLPINPLGPGEATQVDKFVWEHEDMTITFSAGNDGPDPSTIPAPAYAKNDLTAAMSMNGRIPMGSIDSLGTDSSHGPTVDGRFGPTVAAPGWPVSSAKGGSVAEEHLLTGSSMAAPLITGTEVLIREYFFDGRGPTGGDGFGRGRVKPTRSHNPSAALVKATIVNGAERMRGWYTGDDGNEREQDGMWPSAGQGFGRVNIDNSLFFNGDDLSNWYQDVWRADADAFEFAGGPQEQTYALEVDDAKPLDVTLAWTDAPTPLVVGNPTLVNNLDLSITGPDGTVYVGNNFNTETDPQADVATTTPGQAPPDTANVEERVRVANPSPGKYQITVSVDEVMEGPQGFALAASGALSDDLAPARGPGLLPDTPGAPDISNVRVEPVTSDTAWVRWTTDQPTTGTVALRHGGDTLRFVDSYNQDDDGFTGIEEGPVRTSPSYADKPVLGTAHEALVTGISPGMDYETIVKARDRNGNSVTKRGPVLRTSEGVYGPAPADTGVVGNENSSGWKTGYNLHTGLNGTERLISGFMFRLPESIDPQAITGAAVELTTTLDHTNPYVDDSRYSLDLLDDSVESDWGTQNYDQLNDAPTLSRLAPVMADRIGAGSPYSFSLGCDELNDLRATLENPSGDTRNAAFRAQADTQLDSNIFSYDFGFNSLSRGPAFRPRLVLFFKDGKRQLDPLPCDPETPAPDIFDIRVAPGEGPGRTSTTVSWQTDVPSDSTVLFREQGTSRWRQVGAPIRTTHHMVGIDNLDPAKDYEFAVRSKTCGGKRTTDSNNGAGYLFNKAIPETPVNALAPMFRFETGGQGWTTNDDVFGVPPDEWVREGPGYESDFAWNHEPYSDQTADDLTSPVLDHPGGKVSVGFHLRYQLSPSESSEINPTPDALHLNWSSDGQTWTNATKFGGRIPQNENEHWPEFDRAVASFEAPAGDLQIRFRLESNIGGASPTYQGVVVDDVLVVAGDLPDESGGGEQALRLSEGAPPLSAHAENFSPPRTRAFPTDQDVGHGTATCLPTKSSIPGPRLRLRVSDSSPERGDTITLGARLRACEDESARPLLAGTDVRFRRRLVDGWEPIASRKVDSRCRASINIAADFKTARFYAVWPSQVPQFRRGWSGTKVITTT